MNNLLTELKNYRFDTPRRGDDINDHAADAMRYAMLSGAFSKREKKPNKWLVILAILAAIAVLVISIYSIL